MIKIDKSHWKKVELQDVVVKKEENDKDNARNRFDRFLKVEHLDAETFHIKRWGSQDAGDEIPPTFYKIFRKDQILFPTRNPHLRRTAIASFDGICGEKTLTLEAKEGVILPKYLAFLLHCDEFYSHTTSVIVGSTNPHVRWRDVAKFKFFLPPINEQEKLLTLLSSIDDCQETNLNLLSKLQTMLEVKSSQLIWKTKHEQSPLVSYTKESIGKLVDGDWIESKDQSESGIKLLQLADVGVRTFINKSDRYISNDTFENLKCFEVLPGDVLIARMPEPIGRACIVENIDKQMITVVDCCVARVDNKSDSKFLMYALNSTEFLHKANALASGTTRQRISRKNLEQIKIPKPKLNVQKEIAASLDSIFEAILSVEVKLRNEKALMQSLINKVI